MNKRILIWGAGKIGRGFIADIFQNEGYEVCLVDESQELVDLLTRQGHYTVVHASNNQIDYIDIKGYEAFHVEQEKDLQAQFNSVDLMALAVFPKDFEKVASQLQRFILNRFSSSPAREFNIILCTNLIHAGPKFEDFLYQGLDDKQKAFFKENVGVVEALVIRIAPVPPAEAIGKDPLVVWTNGFPELPVDKKGFKGQIPALKALRLVEDMRAEEIRKIYTYNMCHAVLSYLGKFFDYPLLVDCLKDPFVRAEAYGALSEVSAALQMEYGFQSADMQQWIKNVLEHTDNPTIGDTVIRSAADPLRKLAKDDRLIGPALLCLKNGIHPHHLIKGIAAAFHYFDANDAGSQETRKSIEQHGILDTVTQFCGLSASEGTLLQEIAATYHRLPLEIEWVKKSRQAYQLGMDYEKKYHGCGQSVVAAVTETLGIFDEQVFKSATGLCGGIGLVNDSTCSAYIGGVMAVGLVFPRERKNFDGDRENKYLNFELVQQLRSKFVDEFGTNRCAQLHEKKYGRSFDLLDKEEREAFESAGAHEQGKGCTDITGKASMWTIEVLSEPMINRLLQER